MGGDGVMECPDTLEQGGQMEFGTEFGTEVQSEIWYMTNSKNSDLNHYGLIHVHMYIGMEII